MSALSLYPVSTKRYFDQVDTNDGNHAGLCEACYSLGWEIVSQTFMGMSPVKPSIVMILPKGEQAIAPVIRSVFATERDASIIDRPSLVKELQEFSLQQQQKSLRDKMGVIPGGKK